MGLRTARRERSRAPALGTGSLVPADVAVRRPSRERRSTLGGRRGEAAGSPGNELGYLFSARTISRRSMTTAPPRFTGSPVESSGRPWPGGTYAANPEPRWQAAFWGLRAKRLDSSCEERVSPVRTHDGSAAPATRKGPREVQLEPGSNPVRPRATARGWDASCQVPKSFVVC